MIPKITRRSFAIGASAVAVTAATSKLPALAVSRNAQYSFDYFKQRGYTAEQSAGIVGNLMQESTPNVDPRVRQPGGAGVGIAQWSFHERWQDLLRYAKGRGVSEWLLDTQLAFILFEMNGSEKKARDKLRATRTVEDATRAFCVYYERAGKPEMETRIAYARSVYRPGGGEIDLPTLRMGNSGSAVKTMQYMLSAHRYRLSVDGSFGPQTDGVVRKFQSAKRIPVDGVVGPITWGKLLITVRLGSTGDAVRALQVELTSAGYRLAVDGSFGPKTNGAVRAYQTNNRLYVDGIVGPVTWGSLID